MKKNYKKIILLFIQILLTSILLLFIIVVIRDYNKNILLGNSISITILLFYLFLLRKSFLFFNQERIGVAYFLTIGSFFSLMFIQFVTCSNSYIFNMH
jgi:hypothetical protein